MANESKPVSKTPNSGMCAKAAQIALDYAKNRWPHANRITHPLLMREIDRLKAKLRRGER
jgi:hypothetical protein